MLDHDRCSAASRQRSLRAAAFSSFAALSSCVVFFAACSESENPMEVLANEPPEGGSGGNEDSSGGSPPEEQGGEGGSGKPPVSGEGGTQDIDVEQGGSSGSEQGGASGSTSEGGSGGAGGEPTTPNGGTGGAGPFDPNGGTGGQIIPPIDPAPISCTPREGEVARLRLTTIARGPQDQQLTFITAAPGDDTRLFVLDRAGVIRVLENGVLLEEPFLSLIPRVATANEEGLVGLAFHPRYSENGRLFVHYASTDPGEEGQQRIILSEFTRSEDSPNRADPASERVLMVVDQPADIHLAGMLAFGPDRFLYISRGDGGSHDSHELYSWLGKMLRIDVDTTSDDLPYGIPEGNMTGPDVLPEIWSRGWRNPWRFSFDACTGDIYVGDVGEAQREEVDFEPRNTPGRDYGWRTLEGSLCFSDGDAGSTCDTSGLTPPVLELPHIDGSCSVISGYVYRGERIPALRGTYLYTDLCTGQLGSFRIENGQAVDRRDIPFDITPGDSRVFTSFGTDNSGELYLVNLVGTVYRIDPN
jgi:glucose/arabinose dehydrogenase